MVFLSSLFRERHLCKPMAWSCAVNRFFAAPPELAWLSQLLWLHGLCFLTRGLGEAFIRHTRRWIQVLFVKKITMHHSFLSVFLCVDALHVFLYQFLLIISLPSPSAALSVSFRLPQPSAPSLSPVCPWLPHESVWLAERCCQGTGESD